MFFEYLSDILKIFLVVLIMVGSVIAFFYSMFFWLPAWYGFVALAITASIIITFFIFIN